MDNTKKDNKRQMGYDEEEQDKWLRRRIDSESERSNI